jgi:flagellar hook-basal body complex protein FliE
MSIGALDAATAYGRALGIGSNGVGIAAGTSGGIAPSEDGSFAGLVQAMVGDTARSLRSAEAASARQVAGKGDLIDTVTAMGAAETALETVVAVRDRVVNAYSEIMRMQI